MEGKIVYRQYAIKHFFISEEKLDFITKKMQKRHPLENWLYKYKSPYNKITYHLRAEYYCWLEEVYFNRSGFYLDREIQFYKKQIIRLETELNITHYEKEYPSCTIKELCFLFGNNRNVILKAVERMTRKNSTNYKIYNDNQLAISSEGVKWLSENYFRKDYLKELEEYKLQLQKMKGRILDERGT